MAKQGTSPQGGKKQPVFPSDYNYVFSEDDLGPKGPKVGSSKSGKNILSVLILIGFFALGVGLGFAGGWFYQKSVANPVCPAPPSTPAPPLSKSSSGAGPVPRTSAAGSIGVVPAQTSQPELLALPPPASEGAAAVKIDGLAVNWYKLHKQNELFTAANVESFMRFLSEEGRADYSRFSSPTTFVRYIQSMLPLNDNDLTEAMTAFIERNTGAAATGLDAAAVEDDTLQRFGQVMSAKAQEWWQSQRFQGILSLAPQLSEQNKAGPAAEIAHPSVSPEKADNVNSRSLPCKASVAANTPMDPVLAMQQTRNSWNHKDIKGFSCFQPSTLDVVIHVLAYGEAGYLQPPVQWDGQRAAANLVARANEALEAHNARVALRLKELRTADQHPYLLLGDYKAWQVCGTQGVSCTAKLAANNNVDARTTLNVYVVGKAEAGMTTHAASSVSPGVAPAADVEAVRDAHVFLDYDSFATFLDNNQEYFEAGSGNLLRALGVYLGVPPTHGFLASGMSPAGVCAQGDGVADTVANLPSSTQGWYLHLDSWCGRFLRAEQVQLGELMHFRTCPAASSARVDNIFNIFSDVPSPCQLVMTEGQVQALQQSIYKHRPSLYGRQ